MTHCSACGKVGSEDNFVKAQHNTNAVAKNWLFCPGDCVESYEQHQTNALGVTVAPTPKKQKKQKVEEEGE